MRIISDDDTTRTLSPPSCLRGVLAHALLLSLSGIYQRGRNVSIARRADAASSSSLPQSHHSRIRTRAAKMRACAHGATPRAHSPCQMPLTCKLEAGAAIARPLLVEHVRRVFHEARFACGQCLSFHVKIPNAGAALAESIPLNRERESGGAGAMCSSGAFDVECADCGRVMRKIVCTHGE